MALGADGQAYGWGVNTGGQIGDDTLVNKLMPVRAVFSGTAPASIIQVAGSQGHTLLLGCAL